MSTLLRQRADSVVSENGDFLPDLSVLSEEHLAWIQADDVEALRGIDADVLALPTPAKTYALHEACEAGSLAVVEYLLREQDHDVGIRDAQQWTPLHYAAAFQPDVPELVHLLLSFGAEVGAEDEEGDTALDAHLDECDGGSDVAGLLESVAAADDYEAWARAVVRAPDAFGKMARAARPAYFAAAERAQFAVLHANGVRAKRDLGVSPEAFLLGAHGGHVCFDHLLTFLA